MRTGRSSRLRSALRAVAISAGVVLVAAPLIWRTRVLPTLEELPVGFHRAVHLEGHLELAYDPWTLRPVDPPHTLPFNTWEDVHVRPGPGKNVTVEVEQGSQASAAINATTVNQYVLDPHTMRNVDSPDAWAGNPDQVVERAPAFSLGLTPGFDPEKSYPWYEEATAEIVELVPQRERPVVEGLELVRFDVVFDEPPAAELLDNLSTFGLPEALSPDELHNVTPPGDEEAVASLRASLVDLPPELQDRASRALAEPIPILYELEGHLVFDFEPRTGALVRANTVDHVLTARSDPAALAEVTRALESLGTPLGDELAGKMALLANGQTLEVFKYSLSQTPESTAMVAGIVKESLRKIALAEIWLPLSLGASGIAIIVVAAFPRRRTRDDDEWTASSTTKNTGLLEDYEDEWIDLRDKPARSA